MTRKLSQRQLATIRADQTKRYGREKAGIRLPQIYRGKQRESLISRVMDEVGDWRLSPFEHEGPAVAGIRSALCMAGNSFGQSHQEASDLVSEALRRNGAERPTWEQGQPEYTDSPDFCSYCRGPMDEETRTRSQRFCSAECARMAWETRDRKANNYVGVVLRSAYRLISKDKAPEQNCDYCGLTFQSDKRDARFCSTRCVSRWQKGDRLLKDIVCQGCGITCKPANRGAQFCSHSCHGATRARLERERLQDTTRICALCGEGFTPTADRSLYCSRRCAGTAANRMYYQRNRAEHHLICKCCGECFVSKMPWSLFCTRRCREIANSVDSGKIRRLSPPVFDYLVRQAA